VIRSQSLYEEDRYSETVRLKHLFRIVTGSTPKSEEPRYWGDEIPWITPEDLGGLQKPEIYGSSRSLSREGLMSCAATLSPAGSLILSSRAPIGYVATSTMDFAVNQGCRALVPREEVFAPYYRYVLSTRRPELQSLGRGSTFQELGTTDLGNLLVPLLPQGEQRSIVRFLDQETTKIDALIEKNEEVARAAMQVRASRAAALFTRRQMPLRRVLRDICDGPFGSNMKSEHYAEAGVRVIRLQNIGAGEFLDEDRAFVAPEHFQLFRRHEARPGDLLVAGLGDENNLLGRACLVPNELDLAMVKADCFRLRLDESRALHTFVMHYLNSPSAQPEIVWQARGATRFRMNAQGIAAMGIPIPSLDEQRAIVNELEALAHHLRTLRHQVRAAVVRLREYRAALITSAVTGQIDLSGPA
jgi:type I restriction enzyme S subunit